MKREAFRRSPEQFLREVQAEEDAARRGRLKIFLGYASGVGKTVRMMAEAVRRCERGEDVIVGAVQPRISPDASPFLAKLEVIPLRPAGNGFAIDLDAIIRRRPAVCVIDGLAHDNPPGSRNAARWQDVATLVTSGIQVIGSINIQYIDELRETVEAVSGKHVAETVPISFIESADEIEIVDAPAEISADRTADRGTDLQHLSQKLSQLREMALVLAADVVDHQLANYLERQGIHQHFGANERILVCITPRANVEDMLATAQMMAERFHGELIAAYVSQPQISPADKATLESKLAAARDAGARVEILDGDDPIEALVKFARQQGITQLFIGHSQRTGLRPRVLGSPVDRLVRLSRGMDVRVFPQ
jgi:two-component system sensor histidine kinase KdpD